MGQAAYSGTVKKVVADRGFGFVKDGQGQEYFFHRSSCRDFDTLQEGDRVTFDIGQSPKGPRAEDVKRG
jgi:CspA family cold shock protein